MLLATLCGACESPGQRRPNIVLIVLDTFRADRLGAAATGGASLTPNLDALAARSQVWTQTMTTAALTMPSMAAILTGRFGDTVGVVGHGPSDRLDRRIDTLASLARDVGYRTAAVVTNPWLARRSTGFLRGFESVTSGRTMGNAGARLPADAVADAALRAVASLADKRGNDDDPLLLWAHFMDTHMPYGAGSIGASTTRVLEDFSAPDADRQTIYFSAPYPEADLAATRELYDTAVRTVDAAIGTLLTGLRRRGLLDHAVIVVVSDHGEALGEHGLYFAHDFTVYDELVRGVMMIRADGITPGRDDNAVSTVDLLPTVCRLAGLACPSGLDGIDLAAAQDRSRRALFSAGAPRRRRYARAPWLTVDGPDGRMTAVRIGSLKLVRTPSRDGDRRRVHDLGIDPDEMSDVYDAAVHAELDRQLDGWIDRMRKARELRGITSADALRGRFREELRSLGYVD